ncbi:TIGR03757 family integrating conjugative element protein [Pantoea sp. Tr-811]|uniref:TIGR03757 family integrating conjugative element protein n=1 Tax=Pantoea sp. Tr-811 TaxID=2608361 RepID=UPI00141E0AB8|nr:TIGR03757 family integrating conjugative element protein [Pantoea sp. Tr-811]NIF29170.1 TIGR03757 family integrating conjugative element protein [Pantoea sp. Tr-811]
MINNPPRAVRALAVLVTTLAGGGTHAETWAVTDSFHPLTSIPADVRVIKLDDKQRIEGEMSRKPPPNPHQAAPAAQQLMRTQAGAELMRQLASAQQGTTDAWSAGVMKVPAVVINRQFVVDGQPNVAAAIESIQAMMRRLPRRTLAAVITSAMSFSVPDLQTVVVGWERWPSGPAESPG